MREDIKVTKVYRFEELSEETRERALEKLCDINVDHEWWACVYEDANNIGVKIEEFNLNRGSYCRGTFTQSELDVAGDILKQHGKLCDTYQDAYEFLWDMAIEEDMARVMLPDEDLEDFDLDPDFCNGLRDRFRQTIFEDYRLILQEEYDYLTSDEAIRDTIDANEYEFTEDGDIY